MAYQTGGILTDTRALLNQLRLFCLANGFTEHRWVNATLTDGDTQLIVSKGGVVYCFWLIYTNLTSPIGTEALYNIGCKLATGYAAGEEAWNQTGTWVGGSPASFNGTLCNATGSGQVDKYHFFLTGTELVVVFKVNGSWWRSFGVGEIGTPLTTFTGGAFTLGNWHHPVNAHNANSTAHYYLMDKAVASTSYISYAGGAVRADLDNGANPQYHHGGALGYLGAASSVDPVGGDCANGGQFKANLGTTSPFPYFALQGLLMDRGANRFGLVHRVQPVNIWLRRTGDRVFLLGRLASVYTTNLELLAPEDEVTIGADTWIAFPLIRRTPYKNTQTEAGVVEANSHYYGLLVKKTV